MVSFMWVLYDGVPTLVSALYSWVIFFYYYFVEMNFRFVFVVVVDVGFCQTNFIRHDDRSMSDGKKSKCEKYAAAEKRETGIHNRIGIE